jgi:hypothetical protein
MHSTNNMLRKTRNLYKLLRYSRPTDSLYRPCTTEHWSLRSIWFIVAVQLSRITLSGLFLFRQRIHGTFGWQDCLRAVTACRKLHRTTGRTYNHNPAGVWTQHPWAGATTNHSYCSGNVFQFSFLTTDHLFNSLKHEVLLNRLDI